MKRLAPGLMMMMTALAGCAAPPQPLPPVESLVILSSMTPAEPMTAADLFIAQAATWRYEVASQERETASAEIDGLGEVVTLVRGPAPNARFGAEWADEEDDRRVQFWRIDANGDLLLTAVIEHGDQAISLFDPPLVICPATLEPGETYSAESAMRIVSSTNPGRQRDRGTGVSEVEYERDELVRTPLGEVRARRLRTRFEAKLGLATAVTESTLWVLPGVGVIAEEASERITALGLFGRASSRRIVLIQPPE